MGAPRASARRMATEGGGSGGAIRLVANTISGTGALRANGGYSPSYWGIPGQVRLEAYTISFSGSVIGTQGRSTPFPLLIRTAGPPSAKVISINGVVFSPNPSTFPDLMVNTTSPVPVVIQIRPRTFRRRRPSTSRSSAKTASRTQLFRRRRLVTVIRRTCARQRCRSRFLLGPREG